MTPEHLLILVLAAALIVLGWRQVALIAREKRLRRSQAKFDEELRQFATDRQLLKSLLTHSSDHIYFKDAHGAFLLVSDSVAESFGASGPESLIGKTDFDLFPKLEAFESLDDEKEILKTGQPMPAHIRSKHYPDGKVHWRSTCKWALRDRDGTIFGTFGISRDITEEVMLREEIKRLTQAAEGQKSGG